MGARGTRKDPAWFRGSAALLSQYMGPGPAASIRSPSARRLSRRLLVRGEVFPHFGHVEGTRLLDDAVQRLWRQGARFRKQDDLLAEHHEKGDRADVERRGQLLL